MNTKYTVGRAVREARERDNVGLRELSRRSGISPGQISRIEAGRVAAPEKPTLKALADALGRPTRALEQLSPSGGGPPEEISWMSLGRVPLSWDSDELGDVGEDDRPFDWTDEMLETLTNETPEGEELTRHLAHDIFVGVTASDSLAEAGFETEFDPREINTLLRLWRGLTDERRARVLAYVSDQEVLSGLDRRGSNPEALRAEVTIVDARSQSDDT